MHYFLVSIPENPTLSWALIIAVSALAGAVVYLFKEIAKERKKIDSMRDKHEERLMGHSKDIESLLERTLLSFAEVEKSIMQTDDKHLSSLKEVVKENGDKIITEIHNLKDKFKN